jgi:hypothetical protein
VLRDEYRLRVKGKGVLRRIFASKMDEVITVWRKLHNGTFTGKIRRICSRRMRWESHVARLARRGMHMLYWWENMKERDHWENQNIST